MTPSAAGQRREERNLIIFSHFFRMCFLLLYESTLEPEKAKKFKDWLKKGSIDQKKQDASTVLSTLHTIDTSKLNPLKTKYKFEQTSAWIGAVEENNKKINTEK